MFVLCLDWEPKRKLYKSMDDQLQKEICWLLEEKYEGKLTPEAQKDIARLERGEHIDYVIGWVDFLECAIDLSFKPLIPRPETEYWTQKAIEEMQQRCAIGNWKSVKILDIFAGSGCVGVAVAKHIPQAAVDFAEKDGKLLEQIRINAQLNSIAPDQYRIIQSDIFSNIIGKYDFILANPPYIPITRKGSVQESVLRQEPREALFGGRDGLEYIRVFLEEAKKFLNPNGVIYMEFDEPEKEKIEEILKQCAYADWQFSKDQYHRWRFLHIFISSK